MFYFHSNSEIEKEIIQLLSNTKDMLYAANILEFDESSLHQAAAEMKNPTLLYSFLDYGTYIHLQDFDKEVEQFTKVFTMLIEQGLQHITCLTYPGVYYNSLNTYSEQKARIQQIITQSGIPHTFLSVQAVSSSETRNHNLSTLFLNPNEGKYIIPKKSNQIVYSIEVANLVGILSNIHLQTVNQSFDVFDSVYSLEDFLRMYHPEIQIQRMYPLYLHFMSYVGVYISPAMLDIFSRPLIPMHNKRTQKEFEIALNPIVLENKGLKTTIIYNPISKNQQAWKTQILPT